MGASFPLDVLKVEAEKKRFIVRVLSTNYAKVHAALTLIETIRIMGCDLKATFTVLQPVARALPMLAGVMRTLS